MVPLLPRNLKLMPKGRRVIQSLSNAANLGSLIKNDFYSNYYHIGMDKELQSSLKLAKISFGKRRKGLK